MTEAGVDQLRAGSLHLAALAHPGGVPKQVR